VDRNAHDGRGGGTANGKQLLSDDLQVVGRVLHVEQQPIEARVGDDLGDDVVGKVHRPPWRLRKLSASLQALCGKVFVM
jgi:hypothetical protein